MKNGLGHKHVQHLCRVRTQRVWSCGCYTVKPSQLIVGENFKFSAHWLINDALNHIILTLHYPEDPEDVSMEMWGWLGRWERGKGGGVVQVTTNT